MKVKIELTLDVDELPDKVNETLGKAITNKDALSIILDDVLEHSKASTLNPSKLIEDINLIRETLLNMDLQLSNASAMLINYEAAKLNQAAAEKESAEHPTHES